MARFRGARRGGPGSWADHYTRSARDAGFAARSVFKLQDMDRRFALFHTGMRVLDLGAAPGSWSQYLLDRVGDSGAVIAVDLQELDPSLRRGGSPGVVRGDFTDATVAEHLKGLGPFDAVVSDAAPATTGSRTVDTARSAALVESVLASLSGWLGKGGSFVCKVFQGGEEQALLSEVRLRFSKGRLYRPPAVRKASFEAYLIGTGFVGPQGPQ